LPCIVCPLPDKPEEIHADRARGSTFADFEVTIQLLLAAMQDDRPHKDALRYTHASLRNICEVARLVADNSPIAAEPIIMHELEMIGGLRIIGEDPAD
jgi:hypothetical protein